jgi:hypothetical protein
MTIPQSESVSPWVEPEAVAIVAIKSGATCEHCSKLFQPHRGKRFCSSQCRVAFHNAKRVSETPAETPKRFYETPHRVIEAVETPETPPPTPPTPALKPKPEPDFDWNDEDEVIIYDQPTVAVYVNVRNQVVIRSQGDGYWTEDQWVVISRPNLTALISRLQEFERGEL